MLAKRHTTTRWAHPKLMVVWLMDHATRMVRVAWVMGHATSHIRGLPRTRSPDRIGPHLYLVSPPLPAPSIQSHPCRLYPSPYPLARGGASWRPHRAIARSSLDGKCWLKVKYHTFWQSLAQLVSSGPCYNRCDGL
jgi:hypothetical protein